MFIVGDRVTVNERYGQDLDDVVGRAGTVVEVDRLRTGGTYPIAVDLDVVEGKPDHGFLHPALFEEYELDKVSEKYHCPDDK